jgi:NAD(P)-dependent dehydrogenase (short-subunit alcohol dehydrogenase family)
MANYCPADFSRRRLGYPSNPRLDRYQRKGILTIEFTSRRKTMKLLEGKWALVTGSSRGIGQQIAIGLAGRKCNVIVHGRTADHTAATLKLLQPYGVETRAVHGELSSREGIQAVIDGVRNNPGYVDILYNNAAIQGQWKPIWDVTPEEWLAVFQVNLIAMVQLCNAFGPGMKERGWGRIVNLTSGIRDVPNLSPYSVSKAAVDKYTRDLAAELRGSHVLANSLDPGWLKTDLGGENAMYPVEDVLPGALVPALLDDDGPSGEFIRAQDYRMLER